MPSPAKPGVGGTDIVTGNLSHLSESLLKNMESKVVAPRNPKLIKTTEMPKIRMTPSMYMKEMEMDTKAKLANTHEMRLPRVVELLDMSETTHQKVSSVDVEEAMFQPFPSEIYFQNFEPFHTYEVPLLLRNNDKVPRLVKVIQKDSPYFKIISPENVSHKVAPGMASVFKILFNPEDNKDYTHELICMTEREKFIVPVKAIGAHAILDLPDQVNFSVCPVKHNSSKTLLVRNIGKIEAKFSFETESPFSITPSSGSLAVGDSIQMFIEFKPSKIGDHQKDLVLCYDSGEQVHVTLYGAAVDANVRLDKNAIRIDNTYISMANQRNIIIHNRSNVIAHFKWSPFATQIEEDSQKDRFCNEISDEERQERERFLQECIDDPTLRDRMSILTRTFTNRRNLVQGDPLLFADEIFSVYPLEGDIWPNSTIELTVAFKPKEAKSYQRTAFCDITGRETRLPLKIRGDGMGPKLVFSYDSLDIGNVFAGSTHTYEVVLANKGDIDAIFSLSPSSEGPPKGGTVAKNQPDSEFRFDPVEGIVLPTGHQAIEVSFCSETLGDFSRDFYFAVDGSPEQLKLNFKGCVIGPTFHFDVPRLRFGTVSYGFVHSKLCNLYNTSLVPMTFNLRVRGDGTGDLSVASASDLDGESKPIDTGRSSSASMLSLREFDVTPSQGTIRAQSEMRIQVSICSNTLKRYDYALVVDIKGVGEDILSLPIVAKCVVPTVQVLTPTINFGRCFLNYPYQLNAKLLNDSDLPAKYDLLPQVREELSTIVYGSPRPKGILEPRAVVDVPLLIQVHELEDHEVTALFSIFGSTETLPVVIQVIGEGPVVHITPEHLDWGQTQVLSPATKTVELSNESAIPAVFFAQMMRTNSVWKVEPDHGEIPAHCTETVSVSAILDDCIRFHDKLNITIVQGPSVTIPVHAYGYGTTLVTDPPLAPKFNLGPHFAKSICSRKIKLTNRGRRHQALMWSTDGFVKPRHRRHEHGLSNSKDMKIRDKAPIPTPPAPVFEIHPSRLALEPGHSAWVTLEGYCDGPRRVHETLVCHAIIGKANGKEKILKSILSADFVSPVLELSNPNLYFRVDKTPESSPMVPQTAKFIAKNVSSLPLTCVMTTEYPFQILDFQNIPRSELLISLDLGQEHEIVVWFDPDYKNDLFSRIADSEVTITYKEHPHTDHVKLKGEVNFPNLDFSKKEIDFGCILNDTEVARFVDITNNSPMPVSYRWSFVVKEGEENIKYLGVIPSTDQLSQQALDMEVEESAAGTEGSGIQQRQGSSNAAEESSQQQMETMRSNEDSVVRPSSGVDRSQQDGEEESAQGDGQQNEEASIENRAQEDDENNNQTEDGDEQDEEAVAMAIQDSGELHLSLDWSKEDDDFLHSHLHQQHEEQVQIESEEMEELKRSVSRMSSKHQPSHSASMNAAGLPILPWLTPGAIHLPSGVEEIFDILPIYGTLDPGETQRVTFTFYGHADVSSFAKAVCYVNGGPEYDLSLKGEASLIEYRFDACEIKYGKQMFDQVAMDELKLENPGRVGFDFATLDLESFGTAENPVPGLPVVVPSTGHVEAFSEAVIKVYYLPGIPEKFHKSFEIQVAHFEPTIINLHGEGVFPRLALDLPRFYEQNERFFSLVKEARETLENETKNRIQGSAHESTTSISAPQKNIEDGNQFPVIDHEMPSELDVQMEAERLLMKEFAGENQRFFNDAPIMLEPSAGTTDQANRKKRKFPRIRLTDYLLDFGYVILGNVRSHIVRASNTSHFPVSFSTDRSSLWHSGFNVELDRVKQLPGYPQHETIDFKVTFDPRGANLGLGPVEAVVPVNIVGGPQICMRLQAHVTVPELEINTDIVEFAKVQCGQCKVITVQIHNHKQVRCEWTSLNPAQRNDKLDKHVPMHLRRKFRKEMKPKAAHFEMMPARGSLAPGQRMNVQIKFMPTEEKVYSQRLVVRIAQSTARLSIIVNGEGQEPRLEFSHTLVTYGPILPHGVGDEVDVAVSNPTLFPIEVYSLDFDKQYLMEEKILRMMKGYDDNGNILLPPRLPGDELPPELLSFYSDHKITLGEGEEMKPQDVDAVEGEDLAEEGFEAGETQSRVSGSAKLRQGTASRDVLQPEESVVSATDLGVEQKHDEERQDGAASPHTSDKKTTTSVQGKEDAETKQDEDKASSIGVGELEITPVSAAIARHLGIDLTPDGRAARNRRGIAVIIHGPPMSGKTNTAVMLAKSYGAARLTIDGVVMDAISNGNSRAGLRARELCAQTAKGQKDEDGTEAGTVTGGLSVEAVTAHTGGVTEGKHGAASVISTKKASVISKQQGSTMGGKGGAPGGAASDHTGSHGASSPPPFAAPIARRLSVSASVAGEEGLISCVLPEELLIEILEERLQLNDCHHGVIFDGLETLFSANQQATTLLLLKAINNRKHIYFVTQKLDYATVKAKQRAKENDEVKAMQLREEEERRVLEEMDEDEYDALPDEKKEEIDQLRLEAKREKIRQRDEEERLERERIEMEKMQMLEDKLKEEENAKKKKGKGKREETGKRSISGKHGELPTAAVQGQAGAGSVTGGGDKKNLKTVVSLAMVGHSSHDMLDKRPDSRGTDRPDSIADDKKKKHKYRPSSSEEMRDKVPDEIKDEKALEMEKMLQNRFKAFEASQRDIAGILEFWDRTSLSVNRPSTPEGTMSQAVTAADDDAAGTTIGGASTTGKDKPPPSGKRASKKEREKERQERERQERERLEKERIENERIEREKLEREKMLEADGGEGKIDKDGVPHVIVDTTTVDIAKIGDQLLADEKLPSVEEVLDGLGLGPKGPPIPPPANFSVVPYPVKRKPPSADPSQHYHFVSTSPDDPNIGIEDRPKEPSESAAGDETSPLEVASRAESKKEDHPPLPSSRRGKKDKSDARASGRKSSPRRSRKGSIDGGKISPPMPATPGSEADQSSVLGDVTSMAGTADFKSIKLSHFRWVVPAGAETVFRIRFTSEELGQFDQTLNFEITGTRRRYQLFCRGVCSFPTISREPRIVFPHRRKTRARPDEPAVKKYVISDEAFEYGPLLCGKTRERYKEARYPENMEKIFIQNTSPLNADVSFCYQRDSSGTTFLLDPPNMFLKPGETKPLSMWAYPKTSGLFVDTLVCCVRENPEPICFNVACHGVRPEVELDRKHLHFDKVLLHRKETKTLFLRNSTMLPVAWRVAGMENMGDDFSLSQDSGVIEPRCEFGLQMHFRATKAMNLKKTIRLEVSDVENIMGLVQTENVQVTAEAYDVALDMSFPKGADGGLDFGVIRVMDESKQTCSLKNKGRYEIGFCFLLEQSAPNCPPVEELFSILPQKGTLVPNDRPTQVQVVFKSRAEVAINDLPLLRCQVIEPNIGDGGEIIASIPIKLTVRSVFSKYNIFPSTDINFGPMILNAKRTRTFFIENKGEFDFKYTVTKMVREAPIARPRPIVLGGRKPKSRDGSSSSRSVARGGRTASVRQDMGANQTRLIVGSFTVYPGFGTILPGGTQTVTVDCVAENLGKSEEFLALDISDRDPADQGSGIPYRLLAEGNLPSINTRDITMIFEEHRICKSLHSYIHNKDLLGNCGVYSEDDNKFLFSNVIVGRKTYARFKISNTNKVPVDVTFTVKPLSNKVAARIHDIYEVEPSKTQIQPHHFVHATVAFCPPAMNSYGCIFEAAVDGLPSSVAKGRNLFFEITGEGNLPRVSITKPVMRNKTGDPILIYQRQLLGREENLPLTLTNEGTLPSKVNIVMEQQVTEESDEINDYETQEVEYSAYLPDFAFSLVPYHGTKLLSRIAPPGQPSQVPYTTSVILQPGESANFDVKFRPECSRIYNGQIKITVMDNLFEENKIQLFGEGFQDDVTFDNLYEPGLGGFDFDAPTDPSVNQHPSTTTVSQPEPTPIISRGERLLFGDCQVGVAKERSFSIKNHSDIDTVRFQWAENDKVKFSPLIGHLHPGCSKDITATFISDSPTFLKDSILKCGLSKIKFMQSVDQVTDWDDRLRVVKWIDVQRQPNDKTSRPAKKKVVETEAEPEHTVIEGSSRSLDLALCANVNYAKFNCQTEIINFKDTLMFQARVYDVLLNNIGEVQLDYNWKVIMENPSIPRLTSASTEAGHSRQSNVTPRSATQESTVASVLAEEGMSVPFTVTPSEGKILPGKKQYFTVRFAPIEVSEFQARLLCNIPNIEEEVQGPVLKLRGRSLMPYCHFDLKDSDYLSGSRRNPELPGPRGASPGTTLDPNTRVIEFESIGVGVRNIKKFWVMNPTANDYTFAWECDDIIDARVTPAFTCNVPGGMIDGGKKLEVSFEFLPTALSVTESFWKFVILEQNIAMPFLLVGDTKEPQVSMDISHVNFKSLLVGRTASETINLINDESIGFNFNIIDDSCHSEGYSTSLFISPMHGFIPARTRLPLQVSYTASQPGDANFNVICEVGRKTKPLMLNVKACGHSMQAQLICENSQGAKIELSPAGLNAINFGEVELHEKAVRQLYLINSGKHNFTYNWNLQHDVQIMESLSSRSLDTNRKQKMDPKTGKLPASNKRPKTKTPRQKIPAISISPEDGSVAAGTRKRCLLTFQPHDLGGIPTSELVLKVSDGPMYLCHVTGVGVKPGLAFSFSEYSFGSCFIYRAGMPVNTVTLTVTNKDNKENSIECMYENTPHLEVGFQAVVLPPGGSTEATIAFYPRAVTKYRETLSFQINGLSNHLVDILGDGTELRVEVQNPKQRMLKFGALRVGESVKHIVPIVNKSPIPINLNISITPVSQPLHDPSVMYVSPTEPITLAGRGGTRNISVYFTPKTRIPQFTEEVMMECAGMSQPVFVVSGSCQGIEISLDQDSVPFGGVVQRSCSTRRIMMQNTGDIGAGFRWEAEKFAPDFSIEPISGYISPGMEVSFTVTFHPINLSPDIRYDGLLCLIEGGKPLKLTLTGMCIVGSPTTKEVVGFSCHVRGRETRSVMIANRTNQQWRLHPVIDGEYWTAADTLVVDAMQTKAYELTYRPLTMSTDGKKHTGSVFFPLPDGTGLLYNLQGQADPPKPVSSISRDIPCKTAYTELLQVANWLRKPQRFKVTVEMIKPDKLDSGTTLKGLDYIDVPGSVKRDYKLHFYAHKEGTFGAKIVFKNEATSEYIFYYVTFRATAPGVISTIELQTPVRRSAAHSVRVENPLAYPLTFQTDCKAPDINLPPQFTVPANSEGSCMFEYQPLKAGEFSGKLILTNSELGSYMYDLALKAMTAGPEKTTYFNAGLGTNQTITIRFQNYARQKTDYICKIDNSEYSCEKTLTSAPASSGSGTEVVLDVLFEPVILGESRATLTVSSSVGGEYIFPLIGRCTPPRPQGPFVVRAKSSVSVPFKNVFPTTTVFTFQVDNPLFSVKPGEPIRSKKTHNISVTFDGGPTPGRAVTAKLTISCVRSAGSGSGTNLSWIFYLKGITPETQTII
ncbi:hydrocephalus-inducing protein homolog isoform X2 [Styela clava]